MAVEPEGSHMTLGTLLLIVLLIVLKFIITDVLPVIFPGRKDE